MTKRTVGWVAAIVAAAAVLAAVVVASGLRFYTVMTPSMGTTAPVGTLVVTRPAVGYQVGDVVTYQRNDRSYTHRIVQANPDGTFITRGDLNGAADPLPVTAAEIVGRANWVAPGLGWLWQGLPWLALGALLVSAVSLLRQFDQTWRWVVRISGWTLVFCLVAFWLRPWVGLTQLSWVPADGGGVDMTVVNTGLFPLDVLGNRLVSGQDAAVRVTEQNANGAYTLTPGLAFQWWEQAALFLLCLVPLALSFLIRDTSALEPTRAIPEPGEDTEPAEPAEPTGPARTYPTRGRLILIGATVLAIIASVAVVTFTTTSAALTAKVTNSNSAGTRTWFTCRNAVSSVGRANTVYAFAVQPTGAGTRTETDLSGNTTGSYRVTPVTYSSSVGCTDDSPKTAVDFQGNQCLASRLRSMNALATFSVEAWFRAPTSPLPNGKIIGFGAGQYSPSESTYDRHVYLDKSGRVVFGTYNGGYQIVSSPAGTSYADGRWHHVIATFSAATGMSLYLDGELAAANPRYTSAEATSGYWKVGCGVVSSWPNAGGDTSGGPDYFTGQIQYAAVYRTVLSATQAAEHYQAGPS